MRVVDSRQVDCFGDESPRNDEVEPLESSLRDSTHSVESWQSIKKSQTIFHANEVDLGKVCAEILMRIAKNHHIIFLLQGDIGAGKTTLVREFAKKIGIKDSVTSPTFSLLHIYCVGNSPLELHSVDSANFGRSQTPSLVSRPKFAENYESQTENPSVVDSLHESNKKIKSKKPLKSFCYFWLIPKVESTLPLNYNLPNSADSAESTPKIYHYDLYQKGVDYAIDLGLLDLLEQSGIHFVEWGDSQLFGILKNAFENICIISIHKTKNDRIYEFKESF